MNRYDGWSSEKLTKNKDKTSREITAILKKGRGVTLAQKRKLDNARKRLNVLIQEIDSRKYQIEIDWPSFDDDCVTCGREGACQRPNGKCYCSTCWQVWNS